MRGACGGLLSLGRLRGVLGIEFALNAAFRPSLAQQCNECVGQMHPPRGTESSLAPARVESGEGPAVLPSPSPGAPGAPPRLSLAATLVPGPWPSRPFLLTLQELLIKLKVPRAPRHGLRGSALLERLSDKTLCLLGVIVTRQALLRSLCSQLCPPGGAALCPRPGLPRQTPEAWLLQYGSGAFLGLGVPPTV